MHEAILSEHISKFFLTLNEAPKSWLGELLQRSETKILLMTLKEIESRFYYIYYGSVLNETLASDNFLQLLIGVLNWECISEASEILSLTFDVILLLCSHFPERTHKLQEFGIGEALKQILMKEMETKSLATCFRKNGDILCTVSMISTFFPALPFSQCYEDLDKLGTGLLFNGRPVDDNNSWVKFVAPEIEKMLHVLFKTLCNISQSPDNFIIYQVLLVKLVFWADTLKVLSDVSDIKEIVNVIKFLLFSNRQDSIMVGMAIILTLIANHQRAFQEEKLPKTLCDVRPVVDSLLDKEWITEIYENLISNWLCGARANSHDDETFEELKSSLKQVVIELSEGEGGDNNILQFKYHRLTNVVRNTLISSMDKNCKVPAASIAHFQALVTKTSRILDDIILDTGFFDYVPDLQSKSAFMFEPESASDINLGLSELPSISRVLAPSLSPDQLNSNPLVQALRLLSIFYEVNEYWGFFFGMLTTEPLIDRSHFVSNVLEEALYYILKNSRIIDFNIPKALLSTLVDYPFLVSYTNRQAVLKLELRHLKTYDRSFKNFTVPRENICLNFAEILKSFNASNYSFWNFEFEGEIGHGPGPTKEFYTEFSRDCQRNDFGLWIGEPIESSNGIFYVNPPCGLFPQPKLIGSPFLLKSIGTVMAKSIEDDQKLNINFSKSFYRSIFESKVSVQQLTLIDLKDINPSLFKFVVHLVETLWMKWDIEKDQSLTTDERIKAMNSITCDGSSFEDICINFTLPGFPDIEMMDDGKDTLLSIDNLEEYLKLLVWWLLHKGPQESIGHIQNGFRKIISSKLMQMILPDEFEHLFCGIQNEEWKMEYIKDNCLLGSGLYESTPVVQYLFEVLSTLSASEQGQFLQFVTSSPRLPVGGLGMLSPKLTIGLKTHQDNPDNYFPSSMTCVNTLFIAEYSSQEALKIKLLEAIKYGSNYFGFA